MRGRKFVIGVGASGILLLSFLMAACGGGDNGAGLTRAEVEAIVQEEIASAPVAITRDEVQGLVQASLAQAASADGEQLTAADVQEIIRAESANAPGPQGELSRQDLDDAISSALADFRQSQEGMISREVEEAVGAAAGDAPKSEENITARKAELIARTVVASAPTKSSPSDYTKFFVSGAISRYELAGKDAALDYFNSLESIDGQWYMIVVDDSGSVLGHYNENLRGLDLNGPVGTDVNGYRFGPEILSATEEGKWVSYVYRNPEAGNPFAGNLGQLQLKNAWVVRHDDLLFLSGWYIDAEEFTKALVLSAVERYQANGLHETMRYYNSPESITGGLAATVAYYNSATSQEGQWVAFITDETGTIVGIQNPSMVGRSLTDVLGIEALDVPAEGGWITNGGRMRIWAISQDGLTFGSGWYHEE